MSEIQDLVKGLNDEELSYLLMKVENEIAIRKFDKLEKERFG